MTRSIHVETLILVTIAVVVAGYLLILAVAARNRKSAPGHPDDGDGNGGGSLLDGSRPPNPTGGVDAPSWWPEFEREFRAYASRSPSRRCAPR